MTRIQVIGIGDGGRSDLLPNSQQMIQESDLLIGGERQLSFFPEYEGEKLFIKGGLKDLVQRLKQEKKKTVVLASGDPLFYGIGSYLSKHVEVEIHPYLSSVQLAFSRMNESWQDAHVVSVHGRSMKGLVQKIDGRKKVVLLTDQENSPAAIAKYLLQFEMREYTAFVAENLGGEEERCTSMTLEEMASWEGSHLNVVILKQEQPGPSWHFGIEDREFSQRKPEKGLITKKEIRTLSLGALALKENSVVWDIGICTGSVAIEAAKIAREGEVYGIEKNEHDLVNCYENMKKFRADLTVVQGKAPERLEEFPDPDAVFIGGTAGDMNGILEVCCSRLKDNGRIVLNAVTIENLAQAVDGFKQRNYETSITLAQVSRSKPILNLTRFDALNPIYIITATRKED
ncbi:precorrin-6Y C5,15-methyltransferase (decarboxylating) [Fictibacillus enclensis]|uniref:Cobalamin biosynthesis protein CbiE n=1 Tax=Fictibacillus enclensis TaxID=1017270 RepID=A0A0V8JBE2_9BACL|nr:bifunctional cobalt-precorrin-7 (C(5))-methyltransferase/cobalt-precorrin-6B (C(15))-methyltransferase [Fictibacillus enclensis]KSU84498.1 cobalamin biosynthesis protein CbiE [Fictibacillus enclensis]SCB80497.1 precorrin-6Y C5,15-methyltransferase (decarboxylating) [Fictibacillus enclensis]